MKKITISRRISQAVFFGITAGWLAVGALRCPFGVPFISCQSCPTRECPGRYLQLPFIALAALSGLVFGRAFCGWACPVGFVMDVLGKIPKFKATVSKKFTAIDRYLKPLKYVALVIGVGLVIALNFTEARPFPYVVRTSTVFNFDALRLAPALGFSAYAVRIGVIAGALVGGVFISRVWCRYLCPVGALLGLFNTFSLFGIFREREDLPHCDLYPRDCIMHTTPDTTDCVMCGECAEACPRDNLKLRLRYGRRASDTEADQQPDGATVASGTDG